MKIDFKIMAAALSLVFIAASCNKPSVSVTENASYDEQGAVFLAGKTVAVEIADTPDEKQIGLSRHEVLPDGQGMVFPFNPPARPSFWMKDMKFAIDILWIKDNKIVDMDLTVQPEIGKDDHRLMTYSPSQEVDAVLELPSGWADRNNLKVGDTVLIQYRSEQ